VQISKSTHCARVVTIDVIKEGVRFSASGDSGKGSVTLKPTAGSIDDETDKSVTIEMSSPVSMTFSLKYLLNFTKATSLSDSVILSMTEQLPLLVEYKVHDVGYVRYVTTAQITNNTHHSVSGRYYLAPKMGDDEMGDAEEVKEEPVDEDDD
jgi:proliferating cell nuclear antigen PCNA